MTVQELRDQLSIQDPDMQVGFAYNYGDYTRTTVCQKIRNVTKLCVEYSEYHSMDKLLDVDMDEDEAMVELDYRQVVVLE